MPRRINPPRVSETAARIFLLRKAFGKTHAEMARIAKVTRNAWQNYEKGRRRMDIDAAMNLEDALWVPQEWIYRGVALRMPSDLAHKLEVARRALERDYEPTRRS